MSYTRWSDLRQEFVDSIGEEQFETTKEHLLAEVRAYKLMEMRRRRGLTQKDVAERMGVTVGRVSQIEKGRLAGVEVLQRYVAALGGRLDLVANFGDEQLKVG
ncbi:MAG: helix-turn-helix transcriptional regulator [Nocardiopsaceae bacterium]|nr:helix-turn-helix transcriptional regulator [Nocardiopsaceae bacterium]